MASLRRELHIDNGPDLVWDALRDFHAVHVRVAPGFLTACEPQDGARLLTFANGAQFRELLVDCDDEQRRLVYAIAQPPFETYSASVQVFEEPDGRCRVMWTVDMLPNNLAERVGAQMDIAVGVMKPTLDGV